jgi:DedD protein
LNTRYDVDDDLQDLHDSRGQDREISLGTTTILGIFFALALLCAAFFGFGYSLGRRSAPPAASAAETTTTSSESNNISKPAPGSPASQDAALSATKLVSKPSPSTDDSAASTDEIQPSPVVMPVKAVASSYHPDARIEPSNKPVAKPALAAPAAAASPGTVIVQVAAVSHQEDADVLVTALKRRGYSVGIHRETQDKLLHVQIGPFANKKDADAMRMRLQTDGYNAIVK